MPVGSAVWPFAALFLPFAWIDPFPGSPPLKRRIRSRSKGGRRLRITQHRRVAVGVAGDEDADAHRGGLAGERRQRRPAFQVRAVGIAGDRNEVVVEPRAPEAEALALPAGCDEIPRPASRGAGRPWPRAAWRGRPGEHSRSHPVRRGVATASPRRSHRPSSVSALAEVIPELLELELGPVKVLEPGRGAIVVDGRMQIGPLSGPLGSPSGRPAPSAVD
jgi:hypothetical protein